ncbi:MAG: hypothetical protein KDB22_19385 [Planctomycetales bacterium]|nr:hypothetical protein [Planctomycetales bacterium]
MVSIPQDHRPGTETFDGFEPLSGNYIYCPNQFLDLCIPYCSRGTVRIVAYLLRKTLGWLDAQGQPISQEISVRYRDLIDEAGVSRGAIGPALDEAIKRGFLVCIQQGRSRGRNQAPQTAKYALRWSEAGEYARHLDQFCGFHVGEGHRTPVPNRFFDHVVRRESLSVVKVVGSVIRHTVGYQNQFGGRRSESSLSYSQLQRHTLIVDRSTLGSAIRQAQVNGYIHCIESGQFSPDPTQQRAATYALRWLGTAIQTQDGSKIRPGAVQKSDQGSGSKTRPDTRFKNQTRSGSKTQPETRFKNPTSNKDNQKNTSKQHAAADGKKGIELLVSAGMQASFAKSLSRQYPLERIERQVRWLGDRHPTENPIGMLTKAIREDWEPPRGSQSREKLQRLREQQRQWDAVTSTRDQRTQQIKQKRARNTQRLQQEWVNASLDQRRRWIEAAAQRETSKMLAQLIRRDAADSEEPRLQVLDAIALERDLPGVLFVGEQHCANST